MVYFTTLLGFLLGYYFARATQKSQVATPTPQTELLKDIKDNIEYGSTTMFIEPQDLKETFDNITDLDDLPALKEDHG